jgi:hypothetical protein
MKRILTAVATALLLFFPITGFAGYIIHLKDGTQFETDEYYEEGDKIRFKRYNGYIGLTKTRILFIEEKEKDSEAEASKPGIDAPITPAEQHEIEKEAGAKKAEETALQQMIEKKRSLKEKLDGALARLREASKNRDADAKKKAREEMRDYSKQIYDLTEKAKELNNGQLPSGWWED